MNSHMCIVQPHVHTSHYQVVKYQNLSHECESLNEAWLGVLAPLGALITTFGCDVFGEFCCESHDMHSRICRAVASSIMYRLMYPKT